MHTPKHLIARIEHIILQIDPENHSRWLDPKSCGRWLERVATCRLEQLERIVLHFARQIRAELLRRAGVPDNIKPLSVRIDKHKIFCPLSGRAKNVLLQIAREHGSRDRLSLAVIGQLDPYWLLKWKGVGRRTLVELRAALGI